MKRIGSAGTIAADGNIAYICDHCNNTFKVSDMRIIRKNIPDAKVEELWCNNCILDEINNMTSQKVMSPYSTNEKIKDLLLFLGR